MSIVQLYRGMSQEEYLSIADGIFPTLSWYSDCLVDAIDYARNCSSGVILRISLKLLPEKEGAFLSNIEVNQAAPSYNFGVKEIYYTDATWYSISGSYLCEHVMEISLVIEDQSIIQNIGACCLWFPQFPKFD